MIPFWLLTFALVTVKGQVSIPTCCHVQDSNHFRFKCGSEASPVNYRVPKEIPEEITQRLGLGHLGNQSQWVEKDVRCRGDTRAKPVLKKLSLLTSSPRFEFRPDGYLMLRNDSKTAEYLHVDQYCVDEISNSSLVLKYCEARCANDISDVCLYLCCPLGTIYQWQDSSSPPSCVPKPWFPKLYRNPAKESSRLSDLEIVRSLQPRYFLRPSSEWRDTCDGKHAQGFVNDPVLDWTEVAPVQFERFRVDSQGSPRYRNLYRRWSKLVDDQYCLAGIEAPGSTMSTADFLVTCPGSTEIMVVGRQPSEFYGALLLLSAIFALATFLAYGLLFDKQNVHGWTTMSHCVAVFFSFIFLGVAHITKEDDDFRVKPRCLIVATLAQYFFIANFTWLFLLSLDLWLTFKTVSAPLARGGRGVKRFGAYTLTGWGLPLTVVAIAWVLEARFRFDADSEIGVPRYGEQFCYVAHHALWEFIYGPTSILFILNLLLFCWTSVTLYKFQQSTKIATGHMNQQRQSYVLFTKLFFICGLLWMMELLSFAISGPHTAWYLQVFDSVNILQPIAIWVIFVFKWEMINALHERYLWIRPIVFPARWVLKKLRQRNRQNTEDVALHSKVNDTNVSTLERLDNTTSAL